MESKQVQIKVILSDVEAWDIAQFFKRCGFNEFLACAQDREEAYRMQQAASNIQKALAEAGYNPR